MCTHVSERGFEALWAAARDEMERAEVLRLAREQADDGARRWLAQVAANETADREEEY